MNFSMENFLVGHDVPYALGNNKVENDQLPEAANVLYWFEKVHYLLC